MASDEFELVDCVEQLHYLLLFFDVGPDLVFEWARTYDAAAKHVYGEPLPRPATRKPGRLRVGYLSADLRNHVMGKMIWQAVQHHDRSRFESTSIRSRTTPTNGRNVSAAVGDRFEVSPISRNTSPRNALP